MHPIIECSKINTLSNGATLIMKSMLPVASYVAGVTVEQEEEGQRAVTDAGCKCRFAQIL
jgi:hypothetical protein